MPRKFKIQGDWTSEEIELATKLINAIVTWKKGRKDDPSAFEITTIKYAFASGLRAGGIASEISIRVLELVDQLKKQAFKMIKEDTHKKWERAVRKIIKEGNT